MDVETLSSNQSEKKEKLVMSAILIDKYGDKSRLYKIQLFNSVDVVVSESAFNAVGRWFASRLGHTKDHYKMVQTASPLGTQTLW